MQSGVDLTNVKMSMNPFCEIAVEVRDGMVLAWALLWQFISTTCLRMCILLCNAGGTAVKREEGHR